MKTQLINWIRRYTDVSHANGYVVNISGGKDSTVVAALLTEAVGPEKVLGILQPNGVQKDISDSIRVCDYLGIKYINVDIHPIYESIINSIEPISVDGKTRTNIPPRIRMTVARAVAQSIGYRFAGTGNLSERYIGWFTKDGDSACDFNVIGGLTCTQVIKVGDELGLPYELVHKTPEDGLTGRSDEENFGFTYAQLDDFILKGTSGCNNVDNLIMDKHASALHKYGVYTPVLCMEDKNSMPECFTPWFNEDGNIELNDMQIKMGYSPVDINDTELKSAFLHNIKI